MLIHRYVVHFYVMKEVLAAMVKSISRAIPFIHDLLQHLLLVYFYLYWFIFVVFVIRVPKATETCLCLHDLVLNISIQEFLDLFSIF